MSLFFRRLDINLAVPREGHLDDLMAISRLLRTEKHRFLGVPGGELPALVAGAPTMLLVSGPAIWGVVVASWQIQNVSWLRVIAFANGLPPKDGFPALLGPFHALLRTKGIQHIFYAGDISADLWIQPLLQSYGYVHDTQVVVYEKHTMDIPSLGNTQVRIRPVQPVDLAAILQVDQVCFTSQWMKDDGVIGASITEAPLFIAAEFDDVIVGYAFVSSHFDGHLIHLVRIAVDPAYQGLAMGVRLLAEVTSYARSVGAHTLALNTQADNHNAQRLYEWFGFQRTNEHQTIMRYDL
ncbi:MAG: GNAT family N-acetyltransferase [Chloroflexi bacterium AL-W]|nr:GNAT family N-acetyltransferase [Chloroflexi bacterium AL-N1]NOK70288.1 GNAT family N-acetyltransferase [Chloroflexi bacterium AL-N10]NOK77825.1 GNAT family N-acetyltransferase [Chloroflexi bacterium AL-N5]NOK84834.1 GNAT family N-acetyltransferase [Chloroflexi bacterium AL-W]NOK92441.1 GNAT family N-acetyltransferase [Chloroflexi bacterium AL-N15]